MSERLRVPKPLKRVTAAVSATALAAAGLWFELSPGSKPNAACKALGVREVSAAQHKVKINPDFEVSGGAKYESTTYFFDNSTNQMPTTVEATKDIYGVVEHVYPDKPTKQSHIITAITNYTAPNKKVYGAEEMCVAGISFSSGNKSHVVNNLNCIGMEFAAPKGGPGSVEMYVSPVFKDLGMLPAHMEGKVDRGLKGEPLSTYPDYAQSHFTFSWDPNNNSHQSARVEASVEEGGKTYACPPTTLDWNPITYKVQPGFTG